MKQSENSNIEDTVLRCNQQAMEFMNSNNFVESAKLLLKANQILTNLTPTYSVIKLKAVTLNNLGCVYKRGDDNTKALHYLSQALDYEKRLPEEYTNIAGTHLNLCAIKSHLDDHNSALDHALAAVNIIQRNYTGKQEFVTTLVAAYHNAGIEYQYLNRRIEANNFFRQGYDLALRNLGKTHVLTKNIESMLKNKEDSQIFHSAKVKEKKEKVRHETIFNPESRMFDEGPERKIHVDTTPWPKFTEKKSWPAKVEPISQNEMTPKPMVQYPVHARSDRKKEPQIPFLSKFPERPSYNLSDRDSNPSSAAYSKRQIPKNYEYKPSEASFQELKQPSRQKYIDPKPSESLYPQIKQVPRKKNFDHKPSEPSLYENKKPSNIHLHHHDHANNPKPQNVHLHHHSHEPTKKKQQSSVDSHQNFRISTKAQPKSTQSLNSSPSKPSVSNQSLNLDQNPSLAFLSQTIASEKIQELNNKLENLQEKLNNFEANFKKMKTLDEIEDDDSVISTVSIINNKKQNAATMIQKHYKRYKAQKKFKELKSAAIKIQKLNRGIATRRRVHREIFNSEDFGQQFSNEPASEPIVVKMEDRCNQTEKIVKKLENGHIVLVSKQGVRAVKKRKTLLEHIVFIQARIRGFLARKEKVRRLKAIRVIQRKFKSLRIRNIFLKVVSAIVFIQSVFRGHKARKSFRSMLPKGVIALVQSKKRW